MAALTGLRQETHFEGQAAMELEFAREETQTDEAYSLRIADGQSAAETGAHPSPLLLDWSPMVEAILADVKSGVPVGQISAKFHNALAETIVAVARRIGQERVALSGGCFQNRYLTERVARRLQAEGFRPYSHQRVPPNDGGISLGQIVAALREAK
jgi:hydrogenase maturation protein HypF